MQETQHEKPRQNPESQDSSGVVIEIQHTRRIIRNICEGIRERLRCRIAERIQPRRHNSLRDGLYEPVSFQPAAAAAAVVRLDFSGGIHML